MIDHQWVPSSSPCPAIRTYLLHESFQVTLARRSSSVHPEALAPCGSLAIATGVGNWDHGILAHQGLKFEKATVMSLCKWSKMRLNCSKGLDKGGTRATRQNTGCPPVKCYIGAPVCSRIELEVYPPRFKEWEAQYLRARTLFRSKARE